MIVRFLICGLLLALPTHAAQKSSKVKNEVAAASSPCAPTPKLTTSNYPGVKNIPSSNYLLKPAGKSIEAEGQRLVIIGRLLDSRCTPIANATVELWQVDPFGKYFLATPADIANPYPTFAGAGRAYTDNEGHFSFITAFPGAVKNRAPHLNLRVDAEHFSSFSTLLFFADDARNAKEPSLAKIAADTRARVMLRMQPLSENPQEGNFATVDIILPGKVPYRGY